jgi:SAM-dependent methyltransferase
MRPIESIAAQLRAYANKDGRGYPDWAMRYGPIARGLSASPAQRVIEIGANEASFARFCNRKTILADLEFDAIATGKSYSSASGVVADATQLPFASYSADAVLCIDTLEHIPKQNRSAILGELLRVLKPMGIAVVSFPSGENAAAVEKAIRAEYMRVTAQHLRWLEEHAVEGLPGAEETVQMLAVHNPKRTCRVLPNANTGVWLFVWRILICGWPGRGNALAQALLRATTPILSRIHWGKCYRTMIWISPEDPAKDAP